MKSFHSQEAGNYWNKFFWHRFESWKANHNAFEYELNNTLTQHLSCGVKNGRVTNATASRGYLVEFDTEADMLYFMMEWS